MCPKADITQTGTHGTRMLKALTDDGLRIFTISQAKRIGETMGIPRTMVKYLLRGMTHNGGITRLRRGLYALSTMVLGGATIHSFSIATHLVTPSAISHLSALHHHGLTEQVPRVVTAFTPKKVVTPGMRNDSRKNRQQRHAWIIGRIRYEFTTVTKEHFFGIEKVWVDQYSKIPITNKERSVLEIFISSKQLGGIGEALGILNMHLNSLKLERLVAYACRYGRISVSKRLGWVLEQVGVDEKILRPLLEIPATGYRVLDPALPHRGKCDNRWMIQNNLMLGE